jgi:hypothetical protein
MPSYCFQCYKSEKGCGHRFDIVCTMNEISGLVPNCPKCNKTTTVFRDYESERVAPYDPTPKTLGSLAEANTKKYTKEQREEMTRKDNAYLTQPYNGSTPANIGSRADLERRAEKRDKAVEQKQRKMLGGLTKKKKGK